jgi:hypothetical protein
VTTFANAGDAGCRGQGTPEADVAVGAMLRSGQNELGDGVQRVTRAFENRVGHAGSSGRVLFRIRIVVSRGHNSVTWFVMKRSAVGRD